MDNQQKRAKVYDIFQTLAPRYDRANARISLGLERGWKKLLVNRLLAGIGAGEQALDVCCGTGDIAIALADGKAGLRVTGLDFSPAMLAVAKEKGEGRPDLHWVQGDAMQLPFPDGTFGAVCISFGLRNTPDYRRVLQEMKRVGFDRCNLTRAELAGTKLKGIDLTSCKLEGIQLTGAPELRGAYVSSEQAIQLSALLGVILKD